MLDMRNAFIFAPIKLGYAQGDGVVNKRHLDFYAVRSKHVGAVTVEPLYLDPGLREIPSQLGIDSDDKLDGLAALVNLIHSHGAKTIAHLNHPGRMANPKIPGNYWVSSTDQPCENGGAPPKQMDRADMERAIELFVEAARRAQKAGFDAVELQFGHGYLLAQFLSPAVNTRSDAYGGSLENRARFPLEVLSAVKDAVDLPIVARVSGDEMIPHGFKLPEMVQFAQWLEARGADAVHVTAGTVCSSPPWFFQHMFIPKGKTWEFASAIQRHVSVPVVFVGKINSFEDIEKLKRDYAAPYLAIGRALVADPDFVGKYLGLVPGRYRPCLACSDGCLGGVKSGQGLSCVVNPLVGDDAYQLRPASVTKRFAVVGGGLAGMEAAITLKKRGHDVTLYEKDRLGGQFNLAPLPPNKEGLRRITDYYVAELQDLGIRVIHKEATENDLLSGEYDAVVLATGARPAEVEIPGLTEWLWAEVLMDENLFENRKVLIVGGGLIGVEIAHKLLKRNNRVILVELLPEVARGMEMIEKALTLKSFRDNPNVEIYTETEVVRVDGKTVYLKGKGPQVINGVDHVILSTGMKSYNPLENKLKDRIPVYVVGDARRVGKARDAIRDAFVTARTL